MGMGIVHAKFEAVPAVIPADGVGKLGATFVRKRRPLEERGYAHVEAVRDEHVGRKAEWIRVAGEERRSDEIGLFVCRRWLCEFKFKVASILEAGLIRESGGKGGIKFCDAPGVTNVVVAEAGYAERIARLCLNTRWRCPAHPIDFKRSVIPAVDRPIDLREKRRRRSGSRELRFLENHDHSDPQRRRKTGDPSERGHRCRRPKFFERL